MLTVGVLIQEEGQSDVTSGVFFTLRDVKKYQEMILNLADPQLLWIIGSMSIQRHWNEDHFGPAE